MPPTPLMPEAVAWASALLREAVEELHQQYYASWHTIRTNPELVRAKAGVLKELELRLLTKLAEARLDI